MASKMEGLSKSCGYIEYKHVKCVKTIDGKYIIDRDGQKYVFHNFEKVKEWIDWVNGRKNG